VQEKSRGYYLTGRTDALAAAALQDRVHALISNQGGALESVQPIPGVEEQGLIRVTLRVQMSGTTDTLFDILYALEAGTPVLFIDNVDIQSRAQAGQQGEAQSEAAPPASLSIAFDLSGYLPKEQE
jgi:general secretion pathway protein M